MSEINNNNNNNQSNYSTLHDTIQSEKKRLIVFEPLMFLFMFTTFAKFPVFQSLIYEKTCVNSDRFNFSICQNISSIHRDVQLQKEANYLLIASTLCLFIPSIPTALLLGAMFDSWSTRKSLIIPLIGLLLADLNYILQSAYLNYSPYFLLFSDLFFGFTGGFTSIIGLFFAYSVRVTPTTFRPTRMALMEGSMGLGGMCGYFLSGQLRQLIGYAWFFVILSILHLILFIQLIFTKELINRTTEGEEDENSSNLLILLKKRFLNILQIFTTERDLNSKKYIEYGWFNGIDTGSASLCVRGTLEYGDKRKRIFLSTKLLVLKRLFGDTVWIIFLYPLLQKKIGISNLRLALFGLLGKIGSVTILAFTTSTLIAFFSIFLSIFGRFVPTGLRHFESQVSRTALRL
ncbi:hypothetical protein Mgra_00003378 [Meloidogyne graminicola]|uniref:MFS domain-containing protein n=1 Tax=Meloidogyne graminicola TaxID=189291 RepID=A0A8S9ZVM7_9BILA|nr:hypothetical protein Mgra_00003378 [Meloidogyne graminicola]